jgi:hypothetical protein
VRWRVEFYNERQQALARYAVEAETPATAVAAGRTVLRAEHPAAGRPRVSLFDRARLTGGLDADGWELYRIARGD